MSSVTKNQKIGLIMMVSAGILVLVLIWMVAYTAFLALGTQLSGFDKLATNTIDAIMNSPVSLLGTVIALGALFFGGVYLFVSGKQKVPDNQQTRG